MAAAPRSRRGSGISKEKRKIIARSLCWVILKELKLWLNLLKTRLGLNWPSVSNEGWISNFSWVSSGEKNWLVPNKMIQSTKILPSPFEKSGVTCRPCESCELNPKSLTSIGPTKTPTGQSSSAFFVVITLPILWPGKQQGAIIFAHKKNKD